MVTPPGIGTPPPKRPPRPPSWHRIGESGWQTALAYCAAIAGCVLFFILMLWVASH